MNQPGFVHVVRFGVAIAWLFLITPAITAQHIRGALEGKVVIGSMNRGGLAGAVFEMDDRLTGYDVPGVIESGLDGGKMLVRIDPATNAVAATVNAWFAVSGASAPWVSLTTSVRFTDAA